MRPPSKKLYPDPAELAKAKKAYAEWKEARIEWMANKRAEGFTYESIGQLLPKYGFGDSISKVRVETIIRQNRPDLMGSVTHLRDKRIKRP